MKLAFDIYDEDHDKFLSEKDLYSPFINWPNGVYESVYLYDLPLILSKLNHKISLNRTKDEIAKSIISHPVIESESLTFKEFTMIFENEYPQIINYILNVLIKLEYYKPQCYSPRKIIIHEEEEEPEKDEPWKDRWVKNKAIEIFGDKALAENIINTYRILCANPTKTEHRLYITLYSLNDNFVFSMIQLVINKK